MSEQVGKLNVTFRQLLSSGANKDKDISLRFRASDGQLYEFDFDPGCAGMMIYALMQHTGDPKSVQPLLIKAIQPAQFNDGRPMIVLEAEGGGKLPLIMEAGDLNELIRSLQGIATPSDQPKH